MTSFNDGFRDAIIGTLRLFSHFSCTSLGKELTDSLQDGYDRNYVLFTILQAPPQHPHFDEDMKVSAAKALININLKEFDIRIIKNLVYLIPSMPSVVPRKIYDVMTAVLYCKFNMAMNDLKDLIDTSGDENAANCGLTFRRIYATEAVSSVFGVLGRLSQSNEVRSSRL
jgi:hypothetical protein